MLLDIPTEQLQSTVDRCARELLVEAGIECPPVDAFRLAHSLGLTVAQDSSSEVRARFVRLAGEGGTGRGTILLAGDTRIERRHWAVAHEVGEFATQRVFELLEIPPAEILPSAREQLANQLAGAVLLPVNWFQRHGGLVNWDLVELKRFFPTVSHELIARRMLQMSPPVIISLFDQGHLVWRRSNTMRKPAPLTIAEHGTWRASHELEIASRVEQNMLPEGVTDIRCWCVHETAWRREIMRTELLVW